MASLILFEAFKDIHEVQDFLQELEEQMPDAKYQCEARQVRSRELTFQVTTQSTRMLWQQERDSISAVLYFEDDNDAVQFKLRYAGIYEILTE